MIIFSMGVISPSSSRPADTVVRYCRTCLVASVFPAPDSPEMTTLWLFCSRCIDSYAFFAVAKMCGGTLPSWIAIALALEYLLMYSWV